MLPAIGGNLDARNPFLGRHKHLNLPVYSFRQYPVRAANHSDELDGEKLRDFLANRCPTGQTLTVID
jgi:hypothetical protein